MSDDRSDWMKPDDPGVIMTQVAILQAEIFRLKSAILQYESALRAAYPQGGTETAFTHWHNARNILQPKQES